MLTVVFVVIVGLTLWSSWHFYADGRYEKDRPPPDLNGFDPTDDAESR